MTSVIFWISGALLVYTYIAFPLLLEILGRLSADATPSERGFAPTVSVIISALNEERVIEQRLRNLDAVDYPAEKLEIIVASDGSIDDTVRLARAHRGRTVCVLDFPERRGRPAVHNDSARIANGEILLFSDAETEFAPGFIRNAVAFFADPRYGCGAGDYTFRPSGVLGETEDLYWRLEKRMRALEHRAGLLPFASGGCFLIRKRLFEPIPAHLDLDCVLPYRVIERGQRVFYADSARAFDVTVADARSHYRKRVRTALKGLDGVLSAIPALVAAGRGAVVWVLMSHRVIRWASGVLMLALLVSSAAIARRGGFYSAALVVQSIAYVLAVIGQFAEGRDAGVPSLLRKAATAAYGFLSANIAFTEAWILLCLGRQITHYRPVSHAESA